MKVFYDPRMADPESGFTTTTKSGVVAGSLTASPIESVTVAAVHPASVGRAESLIAQLHDLNYVRAVVTGDPRALAESSCLGWHPGTYGMAVAHTAAVIDATEEALVSGCASGALSSGLHHARRSEGAGFCTFNGLAAAALWMTLNHPDEKVVILDLDAHFGGGTDELVAPMPNVSQVDVSTNGYDHYSNADAWAANPGEYMASVEVAVTRVLSRLPDLVIYNAGVDPFDDGVPADVLAERDARVSRALALAEVPVAFTLAGGYTSNRLDWNGLTSMHRATIEAFARVLP